MHIPSVGVMVLQRLILIYQEIDKSSSEINRRQVQINTGNKMVKKLTKAIEESKIEKERICEEKEKLMFTFKEVEQKAFVVQENYKKTQEVLINSFHFSCIVTIVSEVLCFCSFLISTRMYLMEPKWTITNLRKLLMMHGLLRFVHCSMRVSF